MGWFSLNRATSFVHVFFISFCCLVSVSYGFYNNNIGAMVQKYSFKPPYAASGGQQVLYWEGQGLTVVTDHSVQLTPDEKGLAGGIWNRKANVLQEWEVHLKVVIGKNSGELGADGMAFWYTRHPGAIGPVFGNIDRWKGIGIMFDTFDNDGDGQNPSIYAIINDGMREFNHGTDGKPDILGHCQFHYRTTSYIGQHLRPASFKIRYEKGRLSLRYDANWLRIGVPDWRECFDITAFLDTGGFFGVTAATGGVSDHHEVISFVTYTLGNNPTLDQTVNQEPVPEKDKEASLPELPILLDLSVDHELPKTIAQKLYDVEKQHYDFSEALQDQFVSIHKRIDDLDTHSTTILDSLRKSTAATVEKLGHGEEKVKIYQQDIREIYQIIQDLQHKLQEVNTAVRGASTEAEGLRHLSRMRSEVLSEVIEGHSFAFWVFFAVFQFFFAFVAFLYRKSQIEKANKTFM